MSLLDWMGYSRARATLASRLIPTVSESGLKFYCPTAICVWRARTLLTKEPETIEAINNLEPKSVFWDIGANVGMYSLYAAKRGHRVYAFEPCSANYDVLCRNIRLNHFEDRITAWPIALAASKAPGQLFLWSGDDPGSAMHDFNNTRCEVTIMGNGRRRQDALGYTPSIVLSDRLAEPPQHVKIDVDGIDGEIAAAIVTDPLFSAVKSIQVELSDGEARERDLTVKRMKDAGFSVVWKRQANIFKETIYDPYWNWLFKK